MAEIDDGTPPPDHPPPHGPGLAQILERVHELRASGHDPRVAFDRALQQYEASGPGRRATVDTLMRILERAHAHREGGTAPGEAIAQALNDHGASDDLAAVARALWLADMGEGEASA